MSKTAVAGLVSSLAVVCVPILSPVLGLVFGIVGVRATSGGRMRGRKLAIAAIVISLLGGVGQGAMIYSEVTAALQMRTIAPRIEVVFKASSARVPERAAEVYELSSKRFRVRVPKEHFQRWVAHTVAKHGQLQSAAFAKKWRESDRVSRTSTLHRLGNFVNGPAVIDIVVAINTDSECEFDDIRVDGESPLPQKQE